VGISFCAPALSGPTIVFPNTASAPCSAPRGAPAPNTVEQIMAFQLTKPLSAPDTSDLPAALRPLPTMPLVQTGPTRQVVPYSPVDEYGRTVFLLGTPDTGPQHFCDPATETPMLGDTEVWVIRNNTASTHPVHLHLVKFQVISRTNALG